MKKILLVAALALVAAFLPDTAKAAASNHNGLGLNIAATSSTSVTDAAKCETVVIVKGGNGDVVIEVPDDVVIIIVPGRR